MKQANDRLTYMTGLEACMSKLEERGYHDQYKVEEGRLHCIGSGKTFSPDDVTAVNFYRFEGISNPDDMSILFAIETNDGRKGTLVDAFGLYADNEMGEFMREVETHKTVKGVHVY
jgi:hypothetical protein